MIRPLFSLLLFVAFALCARAELIVRNPLPGFGGTFIPERFNLVSVEVQNSGAQPWEGVMMLDDGDFSGGSVAYEQPVFLSPGASRWVQFYPFVTGYQRWRISWRGKDGRGDSLTLIRDQDTVKSGAPVTVILTAPDSPRSQTSQLRPFMENLFPPTVVATSGLFAVVMDHVPRWDAPRRQAFRDWVAQGGIVNLIHDVDGKYPEFSDELAVLNITGERGVFGAGRIVKRNDSRAEITAAKLDADPQLLSDGIGYESEMSGVLNSRLADITKPNIPWGLIYLLTVVYVVLIGPVFFFQRKRDYRVMLGAFVITVVVFAWLFTVVGRRGYGEKQIVYSVGYAESLGEKRLATTQWMYAFATSSDRYRFQYPGGGHAYAVLSDSGTARARVTTGAEAAVDADIPLFSGRSFVHSGVLTGDDISVEVTKWDIHARQSPSDYDADRLESFRIKPNANFPKEIEWMAVFHKGRFYTMKPEGPEWVASRMTDSTDRDGFFGNNENDHFNTYGYDSTPGIVGEARLKARLSSVGKRFVAQMVGAKAFGRQRITVPENDVDMARLFIYARTPQVFAVPAKDFQFGGGYTLYSQTLHKPTVSKSNP